MRLPSVRSTRRASRVAGLLWPLLAACGADPAAPGAPTIETTLSAVDSTAPVPAPPAAPRPARDVAVLLQDGEESVLSVARALVQEHAPDAGARADSIRAFESLRMFSVPLTDVEEARLLEDARVAEAAELPEMSAMQAPPVSWAMDRLDQRALPLNGAFAPGATGRGVRIYILDTGIRATHAEFAGRMLPGYDALTGTAANGTDCGGHGTMVASNAAGTTLGVARDAKVVDVRVLPCGGSGGQPPILAGMDWVLRQKLANPSVPMVANLSLGGAACLPFDLAVRRLTDAGVVVVLAAGNSNIDACAVSPARSPTGLTVGATAPTDARASFSNHGRCIDLFAPGLDVPAADAAGDARVRTASGTSLSAPMVAGVAAAYLQLYPNALPEQVHQAVVNAATASLVQNPGANSPNRLAFVGSLGLLPVAGPLAADITATCVRRTCTLDATTSTGAVASYAWDLGGGATSAEPRATRVFATDGAYPIRLTIRDAGGRTSTVTETVTVRDRLPTAVIAESCTITRVCTFSSAGSTDDGLLVRSTWTFGDGSGLVTSATTARKTYAAYGTYVLRLTVTDDAGQTATVTRNVVLAPPVPVVGFSVSCSSGRTCTFDGSMSRAIDGIRSYRWEFGNTRVGTGVRTTHQYVAAGSYTVRLTVTANGGATAQRTLSLVLR